jgi:hypothetical protein
LPFREAIGNGEAVRIGFQRASEVALRLLHAADLLIGHREIALPIRVARVRRRKTFHRGTRLVIGGERDGQIASRHGDVAEAGSRPENLNFTGALARQLNECAIGFLGGGEISRLKLEPAVPGKPPSAFSGSSATALA